MIGNGIGLMMRRRRSGGNPAAAYAANGFTPQLVADFPQSRFVLDGATSTFADMFTFARASTATYFDSSGVLQTASSGTARTAHYIYNGSSWVNKGLLLESEARTNLVTYSNDFSDASWDLDAAQAARITHTSAAAVSPDGTTNAWHLAGNDTAQSPNTAYLAAGIFSYTNPYSASVYAKAGEYDYLVMSVGPYGAGFWGSFNLSTGAVDTQPSAAEATAYMEDVGNGWYRCWITITSSGGSEFILVTPSVDGTFNTTYTNAANGIYVYGAQYEDGQQPSSYIATSGSTATRAAETLTIAAADLPYSATAMSIALQGTMTYADEGAAAQQTFVRWQADASNLISLDLDTDSTATGEVNANQTASAAAYTVVAAAEYSPGVNVAVNIASAHTSGRINVAKDGTAATEDATPTALPDLSATDLDLAYDFMGTIDTVLMWNVDIGDTGIAEATT